MITRRPRAVKQYLGQHLDARKLGIGPDDLVVDVGSGQAPHPRANVLVDRFMGDSSERACGGSVVADRPLVITDATRTPFPDDSFQFAFCTHLVEHVDEPDRLFAELTRVARRGYIETPSRIYEKLWGWPFHRWLVSIEDGRLVLESKKRAIFDDDLHSWFSTQIERPPVWRFFMTRLLDLGLLTVYVWEGDIAYEIRGRVDDAMDEGFLHAESSPAEFDDPALIADSAHRLMTNPMRLKSRIDSRMRARSDRRVPSILKYLECPACREVLRHEPTFLSCPSCGTDFPIADDVYVMLLDSGDPARSR